MYLYRYTLHIIQIYMYVQGELINPNPANSALQKMFEFSSISAFSHTFHLLIQQRGWLETERGRDRERDNMRERDRNGPMEL